MTDSVNNRDGCIFCRNGASSLTFTPKIISAAEVDKSKILRMYSFSKLTQNTLLLTSEAVLNINNSHPPFFIKVTSFTSTFLPRVQIATPMLTLSPKALTRVTVDPDY